MCIPLLSHSLTSKQLKDEASRQNHASFDRCSNRTVQFENTNWRVMVATRVVNALQARSNFGKLLQRVEKERQSLVIEKRGTPRAVLLSLQDYVRLAAPEPEVLQLIGKESRRKRTDKFSTKQIDKIIKAARRSKSR